MWNFKIIVSAGFNAEKQKYQSYNQSILQWNLSSFAQETRAWGGFVDVRSEKEGKNVEWKGATNEEQSNPLA